MGGYLRGVRVLPQAGCGTFERAFPGAYVQCFTARHSQYHAAAVHVAADGGSAAVRLATRDKGLAEGQFAAFYDGDVCLGSGVIADAA